MHVTEGNLSDFIDHDKNANKTVHDNSVKSIEIENCKNEYLAFKQHVKNKRQSTFCCLFGIGTLILSSILLSASLGTNMLVDFVLFNNSQNIQCQIININQLESDSLQCTYYYQQIEEQNKCDIFTENESCLEPNGLDHLHNGTINECLIYDDNDCDGTMINVIPLQRNYDIFIILIIIGLMFLIFALCALFYAIKLIHRSGIYCLISSVQKDDEKVFILMHSVKENNQKKDQNIDIKYENGIK